MLRRPSIFLIAALTTVNAFSENNPQTAGASVKMTVTANVGDGKGMPQITKDDVMPYKGNDRLPVLDWVVSAHLGHSTVRTTADIYVHAIRG
jgi:hypothetical protein